jgi:C1A family cysteine protease
MGANALSFTRGLGWLPDKKDHRDYTLRDTPLRISPAVKLANKIDLREYDTPIMDQGQLGSCTSQAGCGLLQFLQKFNSGKYTLMSRLYVYKFTRMLMATNGDTGASLRDTMATLILHGAPPETYWNYNIDRFDEIPKWMSSEAFLSNMADNYEGTKYIRLDPDGNGKTQVLNDIKFCLNSNLPVIFGTYVWNSIQFVGVNGDIPMPNAGEQPVGGHALMIVGYDDERECLPIGTPKGAFLIRNSWGTEWGDKGYGWLPYEYLIKGHAQDFWTLVGSKYVNMSDFA